MPMSRVSRPSERSNSISSWISASFAASTISIAVVISGVVALTLSPMMCSRFLRPHDMKADRPDAGTIELDGETHAFDDWDGLVSADLMLLQVLGMARIPWAERAIGQDRLVGWHRWAGFTSFWLLGAHIVLTTLGYAALAGTGPLAELWSLITTAPGMLLATAGTAAT